MGEQPRMSGSLLCESCGEVIGVYEPLVRLLDGRAYETSRAVEPSHQGGEHYHRACYGRLGNDELHGGGARPRSARRPAP